MCMQNNELAAFAASNVPDLDPAKAPPKQVYSVRDAKTQAFSPPFIASNNGEALRQFDMLCKNPETMVHKFPADFALFHIGSFQEQLGLLVPAQQVQQIGSGLEYVPKVV